MYLEVYFAGALSEETGAVIAWGCLIMALQLYRGIVHCWSGPMCFSGEDIQIGNANLKLTVCVEFFMLKMFTT